MRPKERRESGQKDLFRARLDQIIDMGHPLAKLARTIDWRFIEDRFGAVYSDKAGHPPLPMAGLSILKSMHDLSDEDLCARWVENRIHPAWAAVRACLLNVPVLGLHGVEDTVGSERFDRFDESEAAMEAEPFSGVAMPLDVEAVGADPVEASEGRVELLAEIFREAGAVALDEAILGAMPFAEDIDGIVELRRPD